MILTNCYFQFELDFVNYILYQSLPVGQTKIQDYIF